MVMSFKKCTLEDANLLQEFSHQTFTDTFGADTRPEDMEIFLRERLSLERLQEQLANPDSDFYMLWDNDKPAGFVKLNRGPAQSEMQDPKSLEIERIYLSTDYQGQGIGQRLMDFALDKARDQGMDYVWLGVWEDNVKALKFYERNGFLRIGEHFFTVGEDEQTDYLLRRNLRDDPSQQKHKHRLAEPGI